MSRKCPYCAEEIQEDAIKCKHCGSWVGPKAQDPGSAAGGADPYFSATPIAHRRLTRSSSDSMLGGVCAGLAHYLGIDVTVVRVLVAVITFFTAIVPGLILYLILILIIPSDKDVRA